ncbi:MAG TPA: hypothetical protein VFY41_00960, partial [Nitrososphaeraceae archaeon]|nr:hypothetical protein [Nitrososphaeraceae archaeon]
MEPKLKILKISPSNVFAHFRTIDKIILLIHVYRYILMALYGIYGSHTTESCPLNNIQSRKIVLNMVEDFDNIANKNRIKVLEQYHSALEHTFLWIVDTENAHSVERFMIESGWAAFNAVKIVP